MLISFHGVSNFDRNSKASTNLKASMARNYVLEQIIEDTSMFDNLTKEGVKGASQKSMPVVSGMIVGAALQKVQVRRFLF